MRKAFSLSGALLCGTALAFPAAAQTMQEMQQQIQTLQQQLKQLQERLDKMAAQPPAPAPQPAAAAPAAAGAPAAAAAAAPPSPNDWKVGIFQGRPAIYSADGQNSIALVGRLQFDAGEYLQTGRPSPTNDNRTAKHLSSGTNLRRGRIGVTGTVAGDWHYDFVTEFGGLTTANPTGLGTAAGARVATGSILTAQLAYTGFNPVTLVAGYTDVVNSFAEAVSSADITFNERPASSDLTGFAGGEPRAAFGAMASGERWFADAYVTGAQNVVNGGGITDQQTGTVIRAAVVPFKTDDALLHLGVNGSYVFRAQQTAAGTPTITFADQPELRIDPTSLISTGAIPFRHAGHFGAELAGEWKSLWFDAEYQGILVDQLRAVPGNTPDPMLYFDAEYGEVGWFITGEQRPYAINKAAWTTVTPLSPFSVHEGGTGAWELAARYSHANLNSHVIGDVPAATTGGVFGGRQDVAQFGLNWYPVKYVRFLLDYLLADVDRRAANGKTPVGQRFQAVVFRTQVNW